jgi:hypothetical protein
MFVKDGEIVILMENGHQNDDVEKEKENEIQGFSKNFLLCGLVHQNLGNKIRFM